MSEGALVAEAAPAGGGELRARDERVAVDVAALVAVFAQTLAPEETRAKVRGGLGGGGGGGAGAPGGSASGALSLGSVAAILAGGVRGGISGAPRRGGEGAVAAEGGGARRGGHGAPAAAGPTGEQGAVRAARRGRRRGRIWRVSGPRPRRRLGGKLPLLAVVVTHRARAKSTPMDARPNAIRSRRRRARRVWRSGVGATRLPRSREGDWNRRATWRVTRRRNFARRSSTTRRDAAEASHKPTRPTHPAL